MIFSIDDWITMAINVEMLIVTVAMLYFSVKEKAKPIVFFGVIFIFSILVFVCTLPLYNLSKTLGRGNGLFLVLGFVYLLPLRYLVKEPLKKTFTILGFVWFYTFLIYSLSVHIARTITGSVSTDNFMIIWISIQSLLYLFGNIAFYVFLKKQFIPLIDNVDKENYPVLTFLSILWFSFTMVGNYIMITAPGSSEHNILSVLLFVLIGVCALITYRLYYSFIFSKKMALLLHNEALKDPITGLKNRTAFLQDANKLIENKITFSLFFIDLDMFKNINDNYGHLSGDRYLSHFGNIIENNLKYSSTLYRIYGDEFALIYYGDNVEDFSTRLAKIDIPDMPDDMQYLGFSFGYSSYPGDGFTIEKMLSKADEKMYHSKSSKNKKL